MEYNLTADTLLPVQTVSAPTQAVLAGSDMSHRTHSGCKAGLLSTADTLAFWDNVYQDSNCLKSKNTFCLSSTVCLIHGLYKPTRSVSFRWSFLRIGHLAFIIVSGCGPNSGRELASSSASSSSSLAVSSLAVSSLAQLDVLVIGWSSGSYIFGTFWNHKNRTSHKHDPMVNNRKVLSYNCINKKDICRYLE